jgi:hypothetical protein
VKQIYEMNLEEIIAAYSDCTPCVYLIGNEDVGYYKIGKSDKPWMRLHALDSTKLPFSLQMLAILRVGAADSWVESRLHRHFDARRIRGEWFRNVSTQEFLRKAKALHKQFRKEYPR